ncbi:MAG: ubiquinone/menaquinone biosynthesis methyltransferase [Alkalispirochaetaceae bacterium]
MVGRTQRFVDQLRSYDLADPGSKREYNRRLFRVVATRYDAITRVLSLWQDRGWKRRLIAGLPDSAVRLAVDIACGTGDLTVAVADRYRQARVVGVDLSPEMLARARRRRAENRVTFVEADMGELPFDTGGVDLVTGGYALRNAPDLDRLLAELARVLRPGGSLAVLDFSRSSHRFPRELQLGILSFWGRLWGRLLHGNPEVYGYISESLRRYTSTPELEKRLGEHGFHSLRSRSFFFGLVTITRARR